MILVPFLVTRAALVAAIAVGAMFVPIDAGSCLACAPTGNAGLDALARWDGRWYVEIAEHGYSYAAGQQSDIAFFPVYPALMRIAALPLGGGPGALVEAGIVVSNLALLGALVLLVRLARLELGEGAAARVPLMVLAFPTSVFLSAVYPESLFLLAAAYAFWSARTGRWGRAGVAAAVAGLTRPFGIAVGLALVVGALRAAPRDRPAPVWLLLAPAAAAGWWAYLTSVTGEPLSFLLVQSTFRRAPSLPLDAVRDLFDPTIYGFPYLVGALLVLTVLLVVLAWRILSASLAVYATLVLLFVVASGTLTSSMRHELAIIPAFLVLASLSARRWVLLPYLAVATTVSLLLGAMFSRQYWIG